MKSKEQLENEAIEVLKAVGEKIKSQCTDAIDSRDVSSIAELTDSYSKLYELVNPCRISGFIQE